MFEGHIADLLQNQPTHAAVDQSKTTYLLSYNNNLPNMFLESMLCLFFTSALSEHLTNICYCELSADREDEQMMELFANNNQFHLHDKCLQRMQERDGN